MPLTQLRCRDLAPGDILLKVSDGSITSRVIGLGQRLVGQVDTQFIHAGLMFDRNVMIEAQRGGVSANDLRTPRIDGKGNKPYGYLIFRCTMAHVADGAGTFAKVLFDVHTRGRNLKFAYAGAVGALGGPAGRPHSRSAMDDRVDEILAGRNHRFFCAQLVVMTYQFAAEQNGIAAAGVFRDADRSVSPSTLAARLNGHALFREAGYLMPNER
jgi:hypothetical protein